MRPIASTRPIAQQCSDVSLAGRSAGYLPICRRIDSSRLIAIASVDRCSLNQAMEHCITHVCGHAQSHYIPGFTAQQERKATWLRTTPCRACFLANKRAAERRAAITDGVAVASLVMAELTGSERQVAWATGLRAARLAAMARAGSVALDGHPCLAIGDATWWIDRRDLDDAALLTAAVPVARAA